MRRSKFVELASAYLDGEATEEEKQLLQQELGRNPEYRELFASYRLMNKAASKAKFPLVEIKPVSGYRHSLAVSTVSWCVAGSFAGVLAAFVFISHTRNSSLSEDQFVAMDVTRQVVVMNDVKPVKAAPLQQKPDVSITGRTPIQALLADSKLAQNSKDQFKNVYSYAPVEDLLAHPIGNTSAPYSFARANSVTQPKSSLCTPVSFVSMTDH